MTWALAGRICQWFRDKLSQLEEAITDPDTSFIPEHVQRFGILLVADPILHYGINRSRNIGFQHWNKQSSNHGKRKMWWYSLRPNDLLVNRRITLCHGGTKGEVSVSEDYTISPFQLVYIASHCKPGLQWRKIWRTLWRSSLRTIQLPLVISFHGDNLVLVRIHTLLHGELSPRNLPLVVLLCQSILLHCCFRILCFGRCITDIQSINGNGSCSWCNCKITINTLHRNLKTSMWLSFHQKDSNFPKSANFLTVLK